MASGKSVGIAGVVALVGALAATLLVRAIGMALVEVSPSFPPLDGPGPTIFFTTVATLAATGVYALVRRASTHPDRLFRRIAVGVLVLSFLPDVWLLSEGAEGAFQGATLGSVTILMTMHVAAAAVIVWALTREGAEADG